MYYCFKCSIVLVLFYCCKLQDIPALSSEGYEPVTAELGDASPIHLLFRVLETIYSNATFEPIAVS